MKLLLHSIRKSVQIGILVCLLGAVGATSVSAVTAGEWKAGNIIDDAVFYNNGAMDVPEIQAFLESKVPVCDRSGSKPSGQGGSRAEYGTSRGYPPPYVCVKDYYENPSNRRNNLDGSSVPGALSAAQIIKRASDEHGINPRTLLVLLQKEQTLITDDWPWSNQYRSATGFGCPDTAPCDTQYYGFYNQVMNAARQFRRYTTYPNDYRYKPYQNNYIQYNPNAGCGGTNVYVENRATAALYNYTPYQPNASSLNNLYGAGDNCGAYGNRNFWRMFNDWFGSTRNSLPYAWTYAGQEAFVDTNRTQAFSSNPTVQPGGRVYVRVTARNSGNQTWSQTNVRLGTSRSNDRSSQFADTGWLSATRPGRLLETSVGPGQTGTFEFSMKAPTTTGTYYEYFNVLVEGREWLNDPGLFFKVNVVNSTGASSGLNGLLSSGASLQPNQYILSPDKQSVLVLQGDGNLVLLQNFKQIWSTQTAGSGANRLNMQTDGNLVLYKGVQPIWESGTSGNTGARLALQADGNLVLYSGSSQPLWATYTVHRPDLLSYVNQSLWGGGIIYPGQELTTANRKYKFLLQEDGNFVLYSPSKALWSTATDGRSIRYAALQADGNLVLYDSSNRPIWYSRTDGNPNAQLIIQEDGNLVIYDTSSRARWYTATAGQ